MGLNLISWAYTITFLAIAAYYDENEMRIPNTLTWSMMAAGTGLTIARVVMGQMSVLYAALNVGVVGLLLLAGVFTHFIGAGDIKLLMGVVMTSGVMMTLGVFGISNIAVGLCLMYKYIIIVRYRIKRHLQGEKMYSMGKIPMAPAFMLTYAAITMPTVYGNFF